MYTIKAKAITKRVRANNSTKEIKRNHIKHSVYQKQSQKRGKIKHIVKREKIIKKQITIGQILNQVHQQSH